MEIARAGADGGIKARDRLKVVVEHVRARLDHLFQRGGGAFQKVGRQNLDRRVGRAVAHGADRLGEMLRPTIVKVVAVDRGDDHMLEAKRLDRMGDAARLEHIKRIGPPGRDVAEGTAAGADLAHDHHGGVALAPAFADIGAARLFADRHQPVRLQDVARGLVTGRGRRLDPDPIGLFRLRLIGAAGLFGMAPFGQFEVTHGIFPLNFHSHLK